MARGLFPEHGFSLHKGGEHGPPYMGGPLPTSLLTVHVVTSLLLSMPFPVPKVASPPSDTTKSETSCHPSHRGLPQRLNRA